MWPFIDGFAPYVAMMVVLEAVSVAGWNGRGAYTLDIFSKEERVESLAFMRAALNIGFTIGALIGGAALATNNDDVVRAVPVLHRRDAGPQHLLDHPAARAAAPRRRRTTTTSSSSRAPSRTARSSA